MIRNGMILVIGWTLFVGGTAGALGDTRDVGLSDFYVFAGCLTGPGGTSSPDCEAADRDGDDDVDLLDFAVLQVVLVGSTPPAGTVPIAGGESLMGDWHYEGQLDERPPHVVSVTPFYMDVYEVTNQQYADALNWAWSQGGLISVTNGTVFRAATGNTYPYCDTTSASPYGRITWNGSAFGVVTDKQDHPVVQVTWYGAVAFCNWRSLRDGREPCFDLDTWSCDFTKSGYRLPTEAEWEHAAAWDPVQAWHFRFGEHTDGCGADCLAGPRANYGSSGDPFDSTPLPMTTPVGYYDGSLHGSYQTQDARSYYGCYDLCGNVWEWCYDWYDSGYYATSPASDPLGPPGGTLHVLRGGSWYNIPLACRTAMRNRHAPSDRNPNDGFRCVARP